LPGASDSIPGPAVSLATAKAVAKLDEGGCSLVSADAKYVYARAPSCKEVLRIEQASGAVETKKLPLPMLVQSVVDGVAYGCPLGESRACKLTRAPLDGGAAAPIAELPGFLDGPDGGAKGTIAAMFAPVSASGSLDLAGGRYSVETVALKEGARSVVLAESGIGRASLGPGGVLFDGALTPKENVGSPSWGLWFLQVGAAPRRLPVTGDVQSVSANDSHVYYLNGDRELRRIASSGGRDEQITGPIDEPPSEPGKMRVSPAVQLAGDRVYISTASVSACWIWQVPRP
jgi:hypothetical protein